jgi:hypothetical protein
MIYGECRASQHKFQWKKMEKNICGNNNNCEKEWKSLAI